MSHAIRFAVTLNVRRILPEAITDAKSGRPDAATRPESFSKTGKPEFADEARRSRRS